MPNYNVIKKAETPTAIISLCSDGIMRAVYKKNSEIGPKEMQENIDAFNDLREKNYYPFLYSTEDSSVVINNEGLKYSKENIDEMVPRICVAVFVKSLAHKLIANFYSRFTTQKYPYKVFTNYEAAEEWCLEQSKRHYTSKPNEPKTTSVLF